MSEKLRDEVEAELAQLREDAETLRKCQFANEAEMRRADAEIGSLRAEVERLTRERDEVMTLLTMTNTRAESAESELARLRASPSEEGESVERLVVTFMATPRGRIPFVELPPQWCGYGTRVRVTVLPERASSVLKEAPHG